MNRRRGVRAASILWLAIPLGGTALLWNERVGFAAVLAIPVLLVAIHRPHILAPVMLAAAAPFARPNMFGEQYSYVAAALVFGAAGVALIADRGRPAILSPDARPLRSVTLWLFLAYIWLAATATNDGLRPVLQSVVLTVGVVAAAAMVLADGRRARIAGKLLAAMLLALTASWMVTAGLWSALGVGSGQVFDFTVKGSFPQTIYAPFTPTTGLTQLLPDLVLPRFSGLGREPGWMGMYMAFAFFLLPRLGWTKARWRVLCVAGIAGTLSTAGFGVFAVVLAFEWFERKRPAASLLSDYLRRVTGLAVLAGAAWLAINAPVFGLAAKGEINKVSLSDRSVATSAGWRALWNSPLGAGGEGVSGVNLVASIAAAGLPFVLCIVAALLAPRVSHNARPLTSAPISVLLLTLLTSQPPLDSTWVFVAAAMAYAVTNHADPHAPGRAQGSRNLVSASAHIR